jgi:hypothetical protein
LGLEREEFMHISWKYLYDLLCEYEKDHLIKIADYPDLAEQLKSDEEAINQDIQEGKAVVE